MIRREIAGVSGWALIAPLMGEAPEWLQAEVGKAESPIEQVFASALGLVITSMAINHPTMRVQVPIGKYRADIVVVGHLGAPRIVVECDGAEFHKDKARDAKRTEVIERQGYRVVRVTGSEIHHNPIARAKSLLQECGLIPTPRKRAA